MQITTSEATPPALLFASEEYFELFEPKRLVISPLEMCALFEDDLFEDD